MSHEIRTPMHGIIGMTELLKPHIKEPQQEKYLKAIDISAQTLLSLVNDILNISKLESGQTELEYIQYNIRKVLDDVLFIAEASNKKERVKLIKNIDDNFPETIIGDEIKIRQVLTNLIGNALKFTEEGSVELKAKAKYFETNAAKLTIMVKDTGVGIKEEVKDKIFENFIQADQSTTRKFGGTGLGLPISLGIIKAMNGSISVDSKFGEGSTFTVKFKAKKVTRSKETKEEVKTTSKISSEIKILIAEDHHINRELMLGFLENLGFTADIAENGKLAVEAVQKNTYDIIFMDCHMPVMDGFEASRAIIKNHGTNRPFIVACTAGAMEADKTRCLEAGMDYFLTKPITPKDIEAFLKKFKAGDKNFPQNA